MLKVLVAAVSLSDGHAVDHLGLGPDPDLLDHHRLRVDHDDNGVVGDLLEGGDEARVIGDLAPLHEGLVGGGSG